MILHPARLIGGGAEHPLALDRNRGGYVTHESKVLQEFLVNNTVLLRVVLGQKRVRSSRNVVEPLLVVFNLQTKLANVKPDLIQIPAIRGSFKIPGSE
jgi:hypothetical protein